MAFDRGKFLSRFLLEAREHCAAINTGLLSLERNPRDPEVLNEICRRAHTVKGAARMLKIVPVADVAHGMEDVLDFLKKGGAEFSREISSLLFRGIDAMSAMLDRMVEDSVLPAGDDELLDSLRRVAAGGAAEKTVVEALSQPSPLPDESLPSADFGKIRADDSIRIGTDKLDGLIKLLGEMASTQSGLQRDFPLLREALKLSGSLAVSFSSDDLPEFREDDDQETFSHRIGKLHGLLTEFYSSLKEDLLRRELITRELMQASLSLRTLPLSVVFGGFSRTVRDLSLARGKDIDFVVEGGETELDKLIVEKIGDPLLHIIRNAVDHGIESAEDRLASGKRARGTIRLAAWCDGGSVTILVRDDGRGISLEKIRDKALRKNIADRETLAAMSEAELTDMIFLPGFSTSDMVTELSGRGVGLDVVRKSIVDELRGSVRVDSKEGKGTALSLTLPLNLALFRLLFVSSAGRLYAFLSESVEEVVSLSRDECIPVVNKRAVRLRNEVIPVERLADLLAVPDPLPVEEDRLLIAVVAVGNEKLGLVVDAVLDEEIMVVKPLPAILKKTRLVSGATLRGRNQVVPVLSVSVLCAEARGKKGSPSEASRQKSRKEPSVLVVDDSVSTREIEKSIIEAHGYEVVVAGDGIEALEKARKKTFDVIVTDIEMPRLDGFSLTEKLRMDEKYRHTPIIIVTSRERDEDRRRGILVGADAYIVKGSFDQGTLMETIRNLAGC